MTFYYIIQDRSDVPEVHSVHTVEAADSHSANVKFISAFFPLVDLTMMELNDITSILRDFDYEVIVFDESEINKI